MFREVFSGMHRVLQFQGCLHNSRVHNQVKMQIGNAQCKVLIFNTVSDGYANVQWFSGWRGKGGFIGHEIFPLHIVAYVRSKTEIPLIPYY